MNLWRAWQRWSQEHGKGLYDLLALLLSCALCFVAIGYTRLGQFCLNLIHRYAHWHLEALILSLALCSIPLMLFAWRRWDEVSSLLTDAGTDALTGLYNRRKTVRVLAQEFERSARYGNPLSVVIFDIDHFKRVNDTYGHPVGDIVLATIARRTRRRMRTTDHLGRWGGEEFLLICPDTDLPGALHIAERMRKAVRRRAVQRAGQITSSFGVACYDFVLHGDYAALLADADKFLYQAKEGGRDCVFSRLGKAKPTPVSNSPTQLARRAADRPRRTRTGTPRV